MKITTLILTLGFILGGSGNLYAGNFKGTFSVQCCNNKNPKGPYAACNINNADYTCMNCWNFNNSNQAILCKDVDVDSCDDCGD